MSEIEQDNAVAAASIGVFLKAEVSRSFGQIVHQQTQRLSWLQTVQVLWNREGRNRKAVVPVAVPIYSSQGELMWKALVPVEVTICQ